jgi:SagB-type dehydrogenase family enzyme
MQLPEPERQGGMPLLTALGNRRSSRQFRPTPLSLPLLSSLLWAAFGISRPDTGGRTAPSALNAQEVDIYTALPNGLYLYAPRTHALHLVAEVNARKVMSYQDFVDVAPLDLIYVADSAHSPASPEERALYAATSVGAIAQNVYLFCAAMGLSTVARSMFNRRALGEALRLGLGEQVLLAQTVGYPRK